ncbi:MAG: hypothetical protein F2627_02010 [Actinobacteria bacterium]|uniref:Unannotated protein n=1 Tax=freshwater metagenome TaxID=449393 RepID=A0A6J6KDT0_9ZZZZ|nr:hypothetical protein [Actinomycetota bacterium]
MTNDLPRKRPVGAPQRQWRRPVPEDHINHYPPLIAGAIAAGVAVVIGYILTLGFIMAAWLFAAHGSESTVQVLRAAGIAWQVMHLVPLVIGTTTIGVLPWGFLVVPVLILWKATQWALKSSQPKTAIDFIRIAISISLIYSVVAGLIGLICSTNDLYTGITSSILHTLFVALAVTSVCIITYAPSRTILTDAMPKLIVDGIRPAVISFGLLFIAGSLLTSVALILNWAQVRAVTTLMAPGFIDGFFMTLLGIGYLPTVNVWAMSYLLGPGIMLGGGVVNPENASPGALPAFPLLSILPSESAALAAYFVLVPILIGIAIYFLIPRERWSAQGDSIAIALSFVVRWREVVTLLVSVGLLSIFVWIAAAASSGSLGIGYLKFVGPVPTEVAAAAIAVCGLSALLTLVIPRTVMSLLHCWFNREAITK